MPLNSSHKYSVASEMNNSPILKTKSVAASNQGFTLVELIAGIALTLVVSALALQGLSNSQKGYSQDRDSIENGQRLSSVMDIMGRDIRQSGENVNETSFPVIQIIPDTTNGGSKIIMYRALTDPLPVCNAADAILGIPAGSTVSSITTSTSDSLFNDSHSACRSDGNPYPLKQVVPGAPTIITETWDRLRQDVSTNAADQKLPAILHDGQGNLVQFVYTGNSTGTQTATTGASTATANSTSITTTPFGVTRDFPIDLSTIYLIEKREYFVCSDTLKVVINLPDTTAGECPADNGTAVQTIATNIERMDLSTYVRTPTTPTAGNTAPADTITGPFLNQDFPRPATTWQNIQSINILLRSKDLSGRSFASLSTAEKSRLQAEGRFYPRNILSAKRGQ